jgi:uncharacterized protein (DUF4415 family)
MSQTIKTRTGRVLVLPTPEEDAAITAAALSDPDCPPMTEERFKRVKLRRGRPVGSGAKEQLTVRFDTEIIQAFKQAGDGWQTRMNDALREWLVAHRER